MASVPEQKQFLKRNSCQIHFIQRMSHKEGTCVPLIAGLLIKKVTANHSGVIQNCKFHNSFSCISKAVWAKNIHGRLHLVLMRDFHTLCDPQTVTWSFTNTVGPGTTRVWTAQVYLHGDFFFFFNKYGTALWMYFPYDCLNNIFFLSLILL